MATNLTVKQINLYGDYMSLISDDPLKFVETAFDWDSDFLKGKKILDWQRELFLQAQTKQVKDKTNFIIR